MYDEYRVPAAGQLGVSVKKDTLSTPNCMGQPMLVQANAQSKVTGTLYAGYSQHMSLATATVVGIIMLVY
jgi:hypothetical protein